MRLLTVCADLTPVTNGALGTLSVRRRFTNQTGAAITRLRFRVVDITTLNSPGYSQVDPGRRSRRRWFQLQHHYELGNVDSPWFDDRAASPTATAKWWRLKLFGDGGYSWRGDRE